MKTLSESQKNRSVTILRWCTFMTFYFVASWCVLGQEKHSVQLKTFDQSLAPYVNIEVSINDRDYVAMGGKGVAFTELADSDLPVKTIRIRNEQLEAASWNYSKGTLEIIVRRKSYQLVRITVKDENNVAIPNLKVTFKGRKTSVLTTNAEGKIEVPTALDERITAANQFSADDYSMNRFSTSATENVLSIIRNKPRVNETPVTTQPSPPKSFFNDFDLSKLDSIQSLTVFYAIFKNYDRKKLSESELQLVDAKFNELVSELEGTLQQQQPERIAFMGRISDTTFLADDVRNLIGQARQESQTLTDQRREFDDKLKIINDKLSNGIVNLDDATRKKIMDDLTLLERILIENESRFYKNQNDYRQLINAIKERFFEFEDLEHKLTASETQRLEEQRIFRQRLLVISGIVFLFGLLIVLLIYFSNALRKQKKELVLANAEVKRINENLEGLVSQRTRLLESANKELDTFLYRASHDMRTPVRSIMGLCNIATVVSHGESKELVDRISTTTNSMDRLLKKLSIISEINQPSNFSSITLVEVMEQVQHTYAKIVRENKIELVINCPADLVIFSYPNLVETILSNIAENSLYYSALKTDSSPQVKMTATIKEETVVIQIRDNGIGVDPSIKERLFDMFFKGTELSKGNGLGLYIVYKAVQALDGNIIVDSEVGQFTEFKVTLPLKLTPVIKARERDLVDKV